MKEVVIYEYQLQNIVDALRITSQIHESNLGKTSHDRQVRSALQYAKNALNNDKDKPVKY